MKLTEDRILYLEFMLSLLFFAVYVGEYISFYYYALGPVYVTIFLAYVVLYTMKRETPGGFANLFHALFIILLILFLAVFLMPQIVLSAEVVRIYATIHSGGLYTLLLIPLYFIFALGAYAWLVAKKKAVALGIFAAGMAITLLFFFYIVVYFQFGDEVLLGFDAVGQLLHGMNPYTTSISSQLYSNFTTIGATATTSNNFVGTMDYPALYFLSFVPFYFLSSPTLHNLGHIDMNVQTSIFLALLLLAVILVTERKRILEFRFEVILFLALALGTVASVTTFLMLALIIIAYAKIKSKYAFIPLGLALSIQQQIWLPVALLLLYSFNNYGWRQGLRDTAGALAIFLLIDSYFIAINPSAFAVGIFAPVGNIIPFNITPIASIFTFFYPVTLALSGKLVIAASAIAALLMLYWNKKELIPILSLIPLLFLFHTLTGYYTFYLFFMVFAMVLGKKAHEKGRITAFLHKQTSPTYMALAILIAATVLLTYLSHLDYVGNFNLSLENQSLSFSGNSTIYDANIVYHNLGNSTVFLYLQGYSDNGIQYLLYGIINSSIIGKSAQCSSVSCLVNVNRIELPQNATQYHLHAVINGSNASSLSPYMHAILYNGKYVYLAYPVQSKDSG